MKNTTASWPRPWESNRPGQRRPACGTRCGRSIAACWSSGWPTIAATPQYDALWEDCESPLLPAFFEVSFGRLRPEDGPPRPPSRCNSIAASRASASPAGSTASTLARRRAKRCSTSSITRRAIRSVSASRRSARTGPATPLVRHGRGGSRLQRPRRRPLAGRILARGRRRLRAEEGLEVYHRIEGAVEPEPDWEIMRRTFFETAAGLVRGIRHGSSRRRRPARVHRPLPLRRRLPHPSSPLPGEDMAAAAHRGLTEQQQRAIAARGVSVALSAGAGCGKTFALTERFPPR